MTSGGSCSRPPLRVCVSEEETLVVTNQGFAFANRDLHLQLRCDAVKTDGHCSLLLLSLHLAVYLVASQTQLAQLHFVVVLAVFPSWKWGSVRILPRILFQVGWCLWIPGWGGSQELDNSVFLLQFCLPLTFTSSYFAK